MKAVVCNQFGDVSNLVVEERPSRSPGAGEVRVKLHAIGLNFPDILMIGGTYQIKPKLPFIPGMEGAGEIVECGAGVLGWHVGDKVIVSGPGEPIGLYAEEITTTLDNLMRMPSGLTYAEAAGYIAIYATGYHALVQRGALQPGETLVVHGATGGVGTAAVQLGKSLGARVIGTGGDDGKLAVVKKIGADEIINYKTEDLRERLKALTGGRGADVIYDPVGGDVFEASMRAIKPEGRILVIGATSGTYTPAKTNHVLVKEVSIIGVLHGNWRMRNPDKFEANMSVLERMIADGKIRPHVGRKFRLDQAAEGLRALANREVVGKAVLQTGADD